MSRPEQLKELTDVCSPTRCEALALRWQQPRGGGGCGENNYSPDGTLALATTDELIEPVGYGRVILMRVVELKRSERRLLPELCRGECDRAVNLCLCDDADAARNAPTYRKVCAANECVCGSANCTQSRVLRFAPVLRARFLRGGMTRGSRRLRRFGITRGPARLETSGRPSISG